MISIRSFTFARPVFARPVFTRAVSCAAVLGVAGAILAPGTASAGDCNADIANLSAKRQSYIDKLNVIAKTSKGKLDPVASCPQLRGLVAAENSLVKYLEANKNWCNVPDAAVTNLKGASAKSQVFAAQACNIASQAKKAAQQQQAASGLLESQKLPAGPL